MFAYFLVRNIVDSIIISTVNKIMLLQDVFGIE